MSLRIKLKECSEHLKTKWLQDAHDLLTAAGVPQWVEVESMPGNSLPHRLQWYLSRRKDVSKVERQGQCPELNAMDGEDKLSMTPSVPKSPKSDSASSPLEQDEPEDGDKPFQAAITDPEERCCYCREGIRSGETIRQVGMQDVAHEKCWSARTEYAPNSFEQFLLHHRIYCEHEGCKFKLSPAVRVNSLYKNPVAVCEEHWQEKL